MLIFKFSVALVDFQHFYVLAPLGMGVQGNLDNSDG